MPLYDLKRAHELDSAAEPDPFDDPRVLADYKMESLQPRLTSRHPAWVPIVFFDPTRFPTETARERILRHYARTMPGRDVRLEALASADVGRTEITKYPLADEIFRRRGFVADSELTSFKRKDHHAETRYLKRNKAAVCLQLAVVDELVRREGASPAWVSWHALQLEALIGGTKRQHVLLVERDGVFLPTKKLQKHDAIHFAYVWQMDLALDHGRRDREGLLSAMPEELRKQVRFERDHSRRLFGVRPTALIAWQTQALAPLRKITWRIKALNGKESNDQQKREATGQRQAHNAISRAFKQLNYSEKESEARSLQLIKRILRQWKANGASVRPAVIEDINRRVAAEHIVELHERGMAIRVFEAEIEPIAVPATADLTTIANLKDDYASRLEEVNAAGNKALMYVSYVDAVSTEQTLVAALHGATYCPSFNADDPCDREDPVHWLQPLALWIGELKRQRVASLDENIATSILAVLAEVAEFDPNNSELMGYVRLIFDRLGDEVWIVLGAAAEELLARDKTEPLVVVYDWTRDANRPWQAEQRIDGTVVIEGPLLDFPRSRAAFWNERATTIVRTEKGLFCKQPR